MLRADRSIATLALVFSLVGLLVALGFAKPAVGATDRDSGAAAKRMLIAASEAARTQWALQRGHYLAPRFTERDLAQAIEASRPDLDVAARERATGKLNPGRIYIVGRRTNQNKLTMIATTSSGAAFILHAEHGNLGQIKRFRARL